MPHVSPSPSPAARLPLPALILVLALCLALGGCGYGSLASLKPPRDRKGQVDPAARYLVYVHDGSIERLVYGPRSDRYGIFLYESNIRAMQDRGFTVLSELRNRRTGVDFPANRTAHAVSELLAAGVPAGQVTVAGVGSKGGRIALATASLLARPEVGYVLLGSCGQGRRTVVVREAMKEYGGNLVGRFLSIRDQDDAESGSCRPFFPASNATLTLEETQPNTGLGHALFHGPRPEWLDPLARFAGLPPMAD